MNELPFVSVVIPMFNEERSIHACLSSILAQDYPAHRMEVLVIDGASTDRSPEIIRSLHPTRVVPVHRLVASAGSLWSVGTIPPN